MRQRRAARRACARAGGAAADAWLGIRCQPHIIRGVSQTSAVLLSLVAGPPSDLATDVLVTFVPEGAGPDARLDPATGGALASLLGGTELRRKALETASLVRLVPRGAQASRVLVMGRGRPGSSRRNGGAGWASSPA